MTKSQFARAFKIASSKQDLSEVDDSHLAGLALESFTEAPTTVEAFAKFLRWEAQQLNGRWEEDTLKELFTVARQKLTVIN